MRKIFIFIALVVSFVVFPGAALAGGDFGNFDYEYCGEVDGTIYCVEFQNAPFGPGYKGEAFLKHFKTDTVWGPIDYEASSLGSVSSKNGKDMFFHDLNCSAKFIGESIHFYQDILTLQRK